MLTKKADAVQSSVKARDKAIRAARNKGMTLRAIADETGLSHTAIAKICARAE